MVYLRDGQHLCSPSENVNSGFARIIEAPRGTPEARYGNSLDRGLSTLCDIP